MKTTQWVVGVISTDKDLRSKRQRVIYLLKYLGFKVSAFELCDFPTDPSLHSHDDCLAAMDRVDIVILLIDRRFGGRYIWDSDSEKNSITMKEYEKAYLDNKPIICCVSEGAWEENENYINRCKQRFGVDYKKQTEELKAFNREYELSYVDSVEVLEFINLIRRKTRNQFVKIYDEVDDLLNIIKGQLRGLSRYFCSTIIKKQIRKVESLKTSVVFTIGVNEILSKIYVEPAYKIISGNIRKKSNIASAILKIVEEKERVLLIGKPGFGKSILISKIYLNRARKYFTDKNNHYIMPFWLSLKGKGIHYHFSFIDYINDCFEEFLNKEKYPLLDLTDINPEFYLDGFDELSDTLERESMKCIIDSDMFNNTVMMTSRENFAYKYLNNDLFGNESNYIILLDEWDEIKAGKYIEKFCKKQLVKEQVEDKSRQIKKYIIEKDELHDIYKNPLLIFMLLWIIEHNHMNILSGTINKYIVFKLFLELILKRESSRLQGENTYTQDQILNVWENIAWHIYIDRIQNKQFNINNFLLKLIDTNDDKLLCLDAIFDRNMNGFMYGTYHEQMLEYLIAKYLISVCLGKKQIIKTTYGFNIIIRPEVNMMFIGIFNELTESEQDEVYEWLWDKYKQEFFLEGENSLLVRIQLVYFLTKLDTSKSSDYINSIIQKENSSGVRASLFFGIAKSGDRKNENLFYEELLNDIDLDKSSRGFHLAYYGDVDYKNAEIYVDDGSVVFWPNTLNALIKHFENKNEYYNLWRLDLFIIRRIIEVRRDNGSLYAEKFKVIESIVLNTCDGIEGSYEYKVLEEFKMLKKVYFNYI